jgi:hypothetical protein
VQRSQRLQVTAYCPHFQRPVEVTRNGATGALCDCREKERCRDDTAEAGLHEHARPYPHGCPVFPSLAR